MNGLASQFHMWIESTNTILPQMNILQVILSNLNDKLFLSSFFEKIQGKKGGGSC